MQDLNKNEIESKVSSLNGNWALLNTLKLEKVFEFEDFKEALEFVNKVGEIAEEVHHHPDVQISYGEVILNIFTHDKNAITDLDFKLAERIDSMGSNNDEEVLGNMNVLKNGSDFEKRKATVRLGRLRDKRSINLLIKALDDGDRFVQKASARSLGKIGDEKAIKPLIRILGFVDPEFRWAAKEALVEIGKSSEYDLISALKSKNYHQREMAIEALSEIESEKAEIPIKKALSDEESTVRWRAARAVSKWYDEKSVNTLKELAQKDPDRKVRDEAIKSLKIVESEVKNLFNDFEKHLEYISTDIKSKNIKGGKSFSSPEKTFFSAHFFNPYKIRFYIYQGNKGIEELDSMKGDSQWGAIYLQKEGDLEKVLEAVKKSYIITKKDFK
ncbi:4a-hydroxytetrahydrobiopterin dehydratase [Methanobacterium paludis]|uniref:Putative pterin-4-alpha-carbinolamine dehydratase n=1 Tax=Methanobacterium paludis (strain DSM 25820 / JCM 18151 / SWAN1) TaxID=868131 RepID=F6D1Q1_METPW|nr:4a-hydroxytetrahydrobiopterin dehydratase [Methanobacterium paludis]AEG17854.1 pterin-4-alpha-carbinolamine dehydratase [Methanobacterium paludis]